MTRLTSENEKPGKRSPKQDESEEDEGGSKKFYDDQENEKSPQKLYPTAPALEESDDNHSTASAHSTSV